MDETGALPEPGEAATYLAPFLTEEAECPPWSLVPGAQSADGSDILFTQKDIRELQLAKGALAAGIQLLAKRVRLRPGGDQQPLLLAGAFGSTLSPESARRIGLLPPEMEAEVVPVGNAAGEGGPSGGSEPRCAGKLCLFDTGDRISGTGVPSGLYALLYGRDRFSEMLIF